MNLFNRIARLERQRTSADPDYADHWERQFAEREVGFNRFLASVPASHLERVWEALGTPESVSERLFVVDPTWAGKGAPAIARFAWVRATWGDGHPYNPPLPNPLPVALLDLLLDHPSADIHAHLCRGCGAFVPCAPATGRAGEDYAPPRPLADACPVCGAAVTSAGP